MAKTSRISNYDGYLNIDSPHLTRHFKQSEVERIYLCRMEDEIHHGDESFHILLLGNEFLLVGPFVVGGSDAIEALVSNCPSIPVENRFVRAVPYRFREQGLLGLRLFPIPGLSFGPVSDLKYFQLVEPEGSHGGR